MSVVVIMILVSIEKMKMNMLVIPARGRPDDTAIECHPLPTRASNARSVGSNAGSTKRSTTSGRVSSSRSSRGNVLSRSSSSARFARLNAFIALGFRV